MFLWILDTLLTCKSISNIVINTDAKEKLTEAGLTPNPKVSLINRPSELCGDLVSMNKIIDYDLSQTESDIYFMTHATNPFLSIQTIDSAIESFKQSLEQKTHDSLFSVTKHQCRFYDKTLSPMNHDPNKLIPTQNLPIVYEENSLFIYLQNVVFKHQMPASEKPLQFLKLHL